MPWRQNWEARMDSNNILSLLGLALRGGRLVMGEEPVRPDLLDFDDALTW